ncbi:bacillithiol biosynthesis cysteine-adding enzyme BshC [Sungkyunkwania multivorans]|uniref:Putative cysteine ligase BshC n=1 Tax=Sungkyunkwania multivorans TaxID=1173618 RepID=A0ABW3CVQ5_9FLAO
MPSDCIPFKETGYFSALICDYLDQKETLRPFYDRFPKIENFEGQIAEKQASFATETREVLVTALLKQHKSVKNNSPQSLENIKLLKDSNAFTVTTGHQLNLFTGPLYFLYKIIATINLTKELKKAYPDQHFVPVYWMATEDHDFEEINNFNFKGKKFQWNRSSKGAVGRLTTEGLDEVFALFSQDLGIGDNAERLKELFENSYLAHDDLAAATRYLANEFFGEHGLVIVDGDDADLKQLFVPYVKAELTRKVSFEETSKTVDRLNQLPDDYKVQVNPREINLFYLEAGLRERIIENEGDFVVNDTAIRFTKQELLKTVKDHPERFSPNVILRPLFQEVILPNLCYIGGGGELAYWLELKAMFEAFKVPLPMLLLRNSALIASKKQVKKLQKLNLPIERLFLDRHSFINRRVREISDIEIDFSRQKEHLQQQFEEMYRLAEQTDKSFIGAVKAQEVKQLKGLDALEKRLLKAQKRKLKDEITRATDLQEQLFPFQSLQERNVNFSEMYLEYGDGLFDALFEELRPLEGMFRVITL